ncbi:MAG: 30S ribosomal protein S3 [Candidatus Kerfeldbacteria bacterium]|nr:30S ribosomal protein S3 [Candidatus Kerfeldbacteria bacterium]
MGQKVHPKVFRLGVIDTWNSKWFARQSQKYSALLREDVEIRSFLNRKLSEAGLASVDIERTPAGVAVTINTSRPGVVIGRGGTGVEQLKKELTRLIGRGRRKVDVKVNVQEIANPEQNAQVVMRNVIDQIQKRLPFRRVMKHTVDQVMRSGALGAKIILAGRLNGAEIARTEKLSTGKIPLQTLRANVEYARGAARTTYGAIGIKVWIYRGEVFAAKRREPRT